MIIGKIGNTLIVLPITAKKKNKIHNSEVFIEKGEASLNKDSLVKVGQPRSVSVELLGKKYGKINNNILELIDNKLKHICDI